MFFLSAGPYHLPSPRPYHDLVICMVTISCFQWTTKYKKLIMKININCITWQMCECMHIIFSHYGEMFQKSKMNIWKKMFEELASIPISKSYFHFVSRPLSPGSPQRVLVNPLDPSSDFLFFQLCCSQPDYCVIQASKENKQARMHEEFVIFFLHHSVPLTGSATIQNEIRLFNRILLTILLNDFGYVSCSHN